MHISEEVLSAFSASMTPFRVDANSPTRLRSSPIQHEEASRVLALALPSSTLSLERYDAHNRLSKQRLAPR